MDDAEFWRLVERAYAKSGGDCAAQTTLLVNWLSERAPKEIVAFDHIMSALMTLSCDWRPWAAAYIINGGCSTTGSITSVGG